MGDNRAYIRFLLYSYYATITGWGVLLSSAQETNTLLGLASGVMGLESSMFDFTSSRNFNPKPNLALRADLNGMG